MSTGAWVLVVALVLALAFGSWRALTDGRFRGTRRVRGAGTPQAPAAESPVAGTPWADQLGERATLLQFSSAFCAPCRAARQVLSEVAASVPGVVHVEVDAEQHLETVRALGILRTPTTVVLDASGQEIVRASGVPRRQQVLDALTAH